MVEKDIARTWTLRAGETYGGRGARSGRGDAYNRALERSGARFRTLDGSMPTDLLGIRVAMRREVVDQDEYLVIYIARIEMSQADHI